MRRFSGRRGGAQMVALATLAGAMAVASVSGVASGADDVTLGVDPAQSSFAASLTLSAGVSATGNASSPLSGQIDASITRAPGNIPVDIAVTDFVFVLDQAMVFNLNFSFLGSITTEISQGSTIQYATPGVPTAAYPINAMGQFMATGVPVVVTGTATSTGSLLGTPINETIDLATLPATPSDFTGDVTLSGDTALLNATVPVLASDIIDLNGIMATVTLDGTGTIVASGTFQPTAPTGCNPADLNSATASNPAAPAWGVPDGILTPTDFSAFVTFFGMGDLRADINSATANSPASPGFGVPDGVLTPTDFSAFVAYFNAGCPCALPGCP